MKKIYLLLALCSTGLFAQNLQFANWLMANRGGLDFNNGTVVPQFSAVDINTSLSTAAVSDQDGNLLFYTDGNAIFDRNHNIMPNGGGFLGQGGDFAQNIVIVPSPADANQFFVVAISTGQTIFGPPYGLRSVVVDMSIGPTGDVLQGTMNMPLFDLNGNPIDENHAVNFGKITTAAHANGLDYWIVVELGAQILSYLVDDAGIHLPILAANAPLPVADYVLPVGLDVSSINGPMKMALNNDRMLIGYSETQNTASEGRLFIGFFDNATGLANTFGEIATPQNALGYRMSGAEFSVSGNVVHRYYEGYSVSGEVIFDGTKWDDIRPEIYDSFDGRNLQRGIDGRIYFETTDPSGPNPTFMGVITDPDIASYGIQHNTVDAQSVGIGPKNLPPWVYQQPCVRTLTSNVLYTAPVNRERLHWIRSTDFFTGNAVVGIYHAGDFIELDPGFETDESAGFVGYIEGCTDDYVYRQGQFANIPRLSDEAVRQPSDADYLTIYPNPSSHIVTLSSGAIISSIAIVSPEGKTVLERHVNADSPQIDISSLSQGVYLITARTDDGRLLRSKLIKN